MSSREIAELTGKRHDHILRDIEKMIQDIDAPNFGAVDFEAKYQDTKGEWRKEYRLPKDLTVTLVTGYRADLRYKVVKKLEELEGRQDPATILSDPNQLRSLLLVNVEKVIELESQVSAMLPAVEALEQIAEAHGSMNRTEAAKHLGIAPHVLCKWMRSSGWTYRRVGSKDDLAYQSKINAGYLEHKVTTGPRPDGTEWIGTQVRVTPKGLTVLAKAFPQAARAA
nr:phage regulatory protein/antirepressor Ant [Brucella intermedia]